ncbi:hypothetical protein HDU97_000620 [Phlyctochytrium planicorne]|nr:hypothetical protein HDU97_000620 [Phlyctochytrium planicorne]
MGFQKRSLDVFLNPVHSMKQKDSCKSQVVERKIRDAILIASTWCRNSKPLSKSQSPPPPKDSPPISASSDYTYAETLLNIAQDYQPHQPRLDLSADSSFILRYLARINDASTIKSLLSIHEQCERSQNAWRAPDFPLSQDLESGLKRALVSASVSGSASVIEFLQSWWLSGLQPPSSNSAQSSSLSIHQTTEVTLSPPPPSFSQTYRHHGSSALIAASHWGKLQVVRILLSCPHVDPSTSNHKALRWSCDTGFPEIVHELLSTGRTDPTACKGESLMSACMKGNAEIVSYLVKWRRTGVELPSGTGSGTESDDDDTNNPTFTSGPNRRPDSMAPYVDPAGPNDSPLTIASMNGHLAICRLLVALVESSPPATIRLQTFQTAIEMTSMGGHAETVDFLIDAMQRFHNVLPSRACVLSSLEWAAQAGRLGVMKVLLRRCGQDVDPSFRDGMLLREAATRGFVEMVRYLVGEIGMDPGIGSNGALKWAAFHGHTDVVKTLLEVPTLVPSFPNNEALMFASLMKQAEVEDLKSSWLRI